MRAYTSTSRDATNEQLPKGETTVGPTRAQKPVPVPDAGNGNPPEQSRTQTITWAADLEESTNEKTLRVPGPQERDNGAPLQEVDDITSEDDADKISVAQVNTSGGMRRRRGRRLSSHATSMSIERIATSIFVLGDTQDGARSSSRSRDASAVRGAGSLHQTPSSATAHVERTHNLKSLSKEELGGIEYRSLWLLLKIIVGEQHICLACVHSGLCLAGYFIGLHLFGAVCLVPWIHWADPKYREYLHSQGQGLTWW